MFYETIRDMTMMYYDYIICVLMECEKIVPTIFYVTPCVPHHGRTEMAVLWHIWPEAVLHGNSGANPGGVLGVWRPPTPKA